MQNAASENSEEEESRLGTWLDLMGSDLRLKITSRDLSIQYPEPCDVGDAVFIEFTAKTASSSEDEDGTIFQKVDNWLIVIGDKDVTPALEMGIRFMQEGETGFIFSKSKYAYGSAKRIQGKYILPSDTDVSYEVRIQKLIKSNQVLSNPICQVEVALGKKVIANHTYQFEWSDGYSKSKVLNMYKKAGDAMSNLLNEKEIEESVKEKARELLIECLNNIAAVYLRAKEYGKAKEAATRVIVIDPNNLKALLRAARAAIYDPAGTYEESKAAIAAAEIVDPKNRDLLNLKLELQKKIKDYKKRNRQMLSKMSKGIKNVNQKPETKPPTSDKKDETLRSANDSEINASSKETSRW
eukprot:CAMPEP_0178919252 /NCGR_PEP_ID=MMETSP0786-20121207/14328_1 /TAXON_ID=186022 /ORGANISM="Thalassionema frauenfeldii, Strain CCMP 1798" /LENGTH=353 /DNA_ID=CAMNT_0020593151 /DNA_START=53 /DNA_END=1111 /DNA_ORIENTATION=+